MDKLGVIVLLETVKQARIGSIIPVYKELNQEIDAFEYFAKLSNYGKKKNSLLIENNGKSIGTANPCLVLTGKGDNFEIKALNEAGKRFLGFIKKDFGFCDKATYSNGRIYGVLSKAKKPVSEDQRLRMRTHADIIRAVAFKFESVLKPLDHYAGLFGVISSDFMGSVEELPDVEDRMNDPDYLLYFLDNMFIVDHDSKKTYFIANALVTDSKKDKIYGQCSSTIKSYEKFLDKKLLRNKKPKKKAFEANYLSKDEFLNALKDAKRNIIEGNALHLALSRGAVCNYNSEALDIYAKLKLRSDSVFYINDESGISIGTSLGTNLAVKGENEKYVEFNLETAAVLKGNDAIDNDLDNKHEVMLRCDEPEAINHTILLDAARNDVAKVSAFGTRHAGKLFFINKRGHTLSLSSVIKGILKKDLDALHAFEFVFDIGIPRIKSAALLRVLEKEKKGLCLGAFIHAAPDKELESSSAEVLRLRKDKACFKCVSHVFYNTNEEDEARKNEDRLLGKFDIIKSAGEFK